MIQEAWWPYAAAGYTPVVVAVDDRGQPARAVCPACDTAVQVATRGWLTPHGAGRTAGPCDGSFMPVPPDGEPGPAVVPGPLYDGGPE